MQVFMNEECDYTSSSRRVDFGVSAQLGSEVGVMEWREQSSVSSEEAYVEAQRWIEVGENGFKLFFLPSLAGLLSISFHLLSCFRFIAILQLDTIGHWILLFPLKVR